MRKLILGIIIFLLVISSVFLIIGTFRKFQKQKIIGENISQFPQFSFSTLSNQTFNSSGIKEGPVLVVHFHPECEHCQYEIVEILKSRIPISFINVILVSSARPDSIKAFLKRHNYSDFKSVIPLIDSTYCFEDIFGEGIIPSSYVYSKKLKLIKVFHGEVNSEALLNLIQKGE